MHHACSVELTLQTFINPGWACDPAWAQPWPYFSWKSYVHQKCCFPGRPATTQRLLSRFFGRDLLGQRPLRRSGCQVACWPHEQPGGGSQRVLPANCPRLGCSATSRGCQGCQPVPRSVATIGPAVGGEQSGAPPMLPLRRLKARILTRGSTDTTIQLSSLREANQKADLGSVFFGGGSTLEALAWRQQMDAVRMASFNQLFGW